MIQRQARRAKRVTAFGLISDSVAQGFLHWHHGSSDGRVSMHHTRIHDVQRSTTMSQRVVHCTCLSLVYW